MKNGAKFALAALLVATLTGCGSTPQERQASAAAFGAVLGGGAAAAAGAYADARYNHPAVVYVAPARHWQPYCWQSAVTGQWMGCWQ